MAAKSIERSQPTKIPRNNNLEPGAFPPRENGQNLSEDSFMTMKKLLLTLSIILSCGLLIGGLAYAQEAPKAKDDFRFDGDFNFDFDFQEPPLLSDRTFSFFLEGTFLGV